MNDDAGGDAATRLLAAFDRQVGWCRQGASPFSARVLERSRAWLPTEPAALGMLAGVSEDPLAAAVTLRWLGALHHLALLGRQPWAGAWPPARSDTAEASDGELDQAIATAWRDEQAHLRAALAHPPQTNEVQRSAALLPGLLHIAARTGLPLALAEIGSSAGLNLWCDRYRYEATSAQVPWAWGEPRSPLVLRPEWRGPAPTLAPLSISRRSGCDAAPLDLLKPGEDLRLASFVWADQAERLARLKAAIAIVRPLLRAGGGAVQARRAADFVRRELATRRPGECAVLMHSVVWQYIGRDEQEDIRAQMADAGRTATPDAPLAWLRFEPPKPELRVELRATVWPGGEDQLLASCHPHGAWVEWLGTAGSAPTPAMPVAPSAP